MRFPFDFFRLGDWFILKLVFFFILLEWSLFSPCFVIHTRNIALLFFFSFFFSGPLYMEWNTIGGNVEYGILNSWNS